MRTNPPFAGAAIASAAFLRRCSSNLLAVQQTSPMRPFRCENLCDPKLPFRCAWHQQSSRGQNRLCCSSDLLCNAVFTFLCERTAYALRLLSPHAALSVQIDRWRKVAMCATNLLQFAVLRLSMRPHFCKYGALQC